jgi:predicted negative regulator of RcsB-dependent stress response
MESSHFAMLGLANAYLGNAEEAIKAVQTSVALVPLAKDAMIGAFMLYKLASIESRVGRHDEALATLETLLGIPFYVSPAWLRIDPNFAPMRGDPRFARLTGGAR